MNSNLSSDSFKKQEMINEPEYGTLDEIIEKYGRSGEVKGHKGKLYKEKFFEEVSPGHYNEFNFN